MANAFLKNIMYQLLNAFLVCRLHTLIHREPHVLRECGDIDKLRKKLNAIISWEDWLDDLHKQILSTLAEKIDKSDKHQHFTRSDTKLQPPVPPMWGPDEHNQGTTSEGPLSFPSAELGAAKARVLLALRPEQYRLAFWKGDDGKMVRSMQFPGAHMPYEVVKDDSVRVQTRTGKKVQRQCMLCDAYTTVQCSTCKEFLCLRLLHPASTPGAPMRSCYQLWHCGETLPAANDVADAAAQFQDTRKKLQALRPGPTSNRPASDAARVLASIGAKPSAPRSPQRAPIPKRTRVPIETPPRNVHAELMTPHAPEVVVTHGERVVVPMQLTVRIALDGRGMPVQVPQRQRVGPTPPRNR